MTRHRLAWILAGLCLGGLVHAQTEPVAPVTPGADDALLQPGDKILVQVWGESVPQPVFEVSPTGQLLLTPYYIGAVPAAGKTLGELKQDILARLAEFYRDPQVTMAIVEFGPRRSLAYVFGQVQRPGAYQVAWGDTVLTLVAQAGGLLPSGDAHNTSLVRASGSAITLDLNRLIQHGDQSQNLVVQAGDTLVVPPARATVLGAVQTPGEFPIMAEMKVLNLLSLAGGVLAQGAASRARLVRREGAVQPVDLAALLYSGEVAHNLPVQAGDILFVPLTRTDTGVTVLGDVRAPGMVAYRPGMTLLEAFIMAGGYREGVVAAAGRIVRNEETIESDIDRLLRLGDVSQNAVLETGDVIIVRGSEREVMLLGEVERPGIYPLVPDATLIQVLGRGGELLARADRTDVQILRDGERLHSNVRKILEEGDTRENHLLKPGDIILVPRRGEWQVTVLGYVQQPGIHVWQEDETLQMAITQAGGVAGPGKYRAVVTRSDGAREQADLTALYLEGDISQDLPIRSGDLILVEPASEWVWVLGRVQKPGKHLVQPEETLLEALAMAGGTLGGGLSTPFQPAATPQTERLDAVISRGNQTVNVDLHALIYDGKLSENVPIQGGDLIIVRSQGAEVTVVGAVSNPGVHPYQERESLLNALSLAGGLLPEADWTGVSVVRADETLPVNLNRLLQEGDPTQNIGLQPGDIVIVPEAVRVVVYGEVQAPGSYPVERREKLISLITKAGGRTDKADLAHITILRGDEVVIADLLKMQEEGDDSDNLALQSGDRVFVPPRDEALVFGAAARPGFYPVTPDLTLMRLVTEAGVGQGSNLRRVAIIRLPGESIEPGAQIEPIEVDVSKMMKEGDLTDNIAIQSGDIVYIPAISRGGRGFQIRDFYELFLGVDVFLRTLRRF